MAITFDSVTEGNTITSLAHTCTGSNLIVFGQIFHSTSSGTVTGASYAGSAMTEVARTSAGAQEIILFYQVAPSTGSQNFTYTGTDPSVDMVVVSYAGAKQTGVPDASANTNAAGTTSVSQSITTVSDNCWQIASVRNTAVAPTATGSPATQRTTGGGSGASYWDSNAALTPAGSYTASFTSTSADWALVTCSFAPVVAGGTTLNSLSLTGVGV